MTTVELITLTSVLWALAGAVLGMWMYLRGYEDGQNGMCAAWETAYKIWYDEGYADGWEAGEKCGR